jgi:hypothetical protein
MLAAADAILIPVQCEYYALEGLTQLLNTIHLIQRGVNEKLTIDGVLLTMYDARLNLSRQVMADAREYFGSQVFQTIIPRSVRLAEAPSFGKPIILYDVASVGAQAYMSVARELLERHRHDGSRQDADAQDADRQRVTTPAVVHAAEADRPTTQPADEGSGPTHDPTQQRVEYEASQSQPSEERPLDHTALDDTAIEQRPTEERISEPHTAQRPPTDHPVAHQHAVDKHPANEHSTEPNANVGDQQRGDSTLSELVHTEPLHVE